MSTAPLSTLSSIQQSGAEAATAAATPPKNTLGKDDFLKLLTTQLQHQDPLQPMDSQAFIAQLAQFSSVEQLTALGTRLDTLLVAQASANQLQTASLVGKEVLFRSDQLRLDGKPVAAQARLSRDERRPPTASPLSASRRLPSPKGLRRGGAAPLDFSPPFRNHC